MVAAPHQISELDAHTVEDKVENVDEEEEGGEGEQGPQKPKGWTWEHHTYLFERLLTDYLEAHRRKPKCAEFDQIAEDLYNNFKGSKIPVGVEFTSAKGSGFGYHNRTRHEFPRRTGHNVHSYVNTTMKEEYQMLLRRFLGPEMGKKKPKPTPRKDKSVPHTPKKKKDGDDGGGGGGGIGSMWNKPF